MSLLFAVACERGVDTSSGDAEVLTDLPNRPGGNPLVPEVAMFPFPSNPFLVEADTETGYLVDLPDEALPEGLPDLFQDMDGFSAAHPILTWLDGGFDPATLPDPHDLGASVAEDASVSLVDAETLERLPVLVEVDHQAAHWSNQALIIRPQRTLAFDADYVVLLTDALRTAEGEPHELVEAFRALRDGIATDSDAVESQREDFELVNGVIDALYGTRDGVIQAWTFHTRSEDNVTLASRSMHEAMATAELGAFVVTSDTVEDGQRLIEGSFTVPDFLDPETQRTSFDADGLPVQTGERVVEVLLAIPETVVGPRPVLTYGHGFFSAKEELTWSSLHDGLAEWQVSAVAFDFLGFSEDWAAQSIGGLAADLAQMAVLADQQRQNQAMFTALSRLVVEQLAGAYPELDPQAVHYMGISNGSTQGLPIVALSPAYRRGVLVVGGCGWSHFMQRAVQWNELGALMEVRFPDPMDLQLALSASQLVLDPIDGANYAARLLDDRFDGRTDVDVVLHQAVGDAQVANLLTDWCARTAGVPMVVPTPRDAYGVVTVPADGTDATSAWFVYDENYPPNPEGNVPPEEDNGAHGSVRNLPAYKAQVGAFLEDGTIEQVCDGACDPD